MKKTVRFVVIVTVLILLAAGWTWRYVTLNQYYDDLDNSDYKLYQAGELVPFEDDGNDMYTDLNGYYIRVDSYEVVDYDAYAAELGMTLPEEQLSPDKLALVTVTLCNESCEPNPVMLTDMMLHGVDTVTAMDWDALVKANPVLDGNTGIALNPGTECKLILPYGLRKEQFDSFTWGKIDRYEVFLQVTSTLTTKDIAVNG